MNDVDWRAQSRALGIERRAPATRPDRGFVEQPAERVETTQIRRRVVTPTTPRAPVPLISLADMDEHSELLDELTRPDPVHANDPMPPAPEKHTMNPPNEAREDRDDAMLAAIQREIDRPMAKATKAKMSYTVIDEARKLAAVKAVIEQGKTHKEVSGPLGVSPASISLWVARYKRTGRVPAKTGKEKGGDVRRLDKAARRRPARSNERTMVSGAGGPPSAVLSVRASIRSNGARTFDQVKAELDAAIEHVSDLKRELRDMLAD